MAKVKYHKGTSNLSLKFHNDSKQFLLQLKKDFTTYPAIYTIECSNIYYARLYPILKSYNHIKECEFKDWTELRDKVGLSEKYERWADFKRRFIRGAQTYFLLNTDVAFGITEEIKVGRKVQGIKIRILDISCGLKNRKHKGRQYVKPKSSKQLKLEFFK